MELEPSETLEGVVELTLPEHQATLLLEAFCSSFTSGACSCTRTGSISEYLQQNGISQRLADNIDEEREAPREKWPNMVTTALVIMELERRTGFHLEVFSTYRTGNSTSAHATYGAVDVRARYETGNGEKGNRSQEELGVLSESLS